MIGSFDFADVLDEAIDRSGGQEATAADVLKVRRGMRILTERWTAAGFNTWRIKNFTSQVNGTSPKISLPERVDDVMQVTAVRSGLSESVLHRIPPSQYMQITTKDTQGQPSQYYLDRTEPPTLFVHPIGTPSVPDTIVVYYVERPADYDAYDDLTSDVPGRWLEALISGLALDLARKRPPYNEALIQRLKLEAVEAEDLAQRADRGRQHYQYRTSYGR